MKYMNDSWLGGSDTGFKFHIYWGKGENPDLGVGWAALLRACPKPFLSTCFPSLQIELEAVWPFSNKMHFFEHEIELSDYIN